MITITIELTAEEEDALKRAARMDLRDLKDEAMHILRSELQRRGLLRVTKIIEGKRKRFIEIND